MEDKNGIQKSIDQMGMEGVIRYLPKGMKLYDCPIHGKFVAHYKDANPLCPLCIAPSGDGNGTTASDVELFIDLQKQKQAMDRLLAPCDQVPLNTVNL